MTLYAISIRFKIFLLATYVYPQAIAGGPKEKKNPHVHVRKASCLNMNFNNVKHR